MLYGEFRCALDEKGRLNFPARFRDEMGDSFFITSWLDDCVAAFPAGQWERIREKMAEKSMVKGRAVNRFLYARAAEAVPDKQGRVMIPPALRKHASLEKEIVVIGVGAYAEIWDAAAWDAAAEELNSVNVEALMEELDF